MAEIIAPHGEITDTELVKGKFYKSFYKLLSIWRFAKYEGPFLSPDSKMLRFIIYNPDNTEKKIIVNKTLVRLYPLTQSMEGIPFEGGTPNLSELYAQTQGNAWTRRGNAVAAFHKAATNRNNRRRANRRTRRRRNRQ
jgi:hypothetical protein